MTHNARFRRMWKRSLASSFVIATTLMRSSVTRAKALQPLATLTQSSQSLFRLKYCKHLDISTFQYSKSSFKNEGRGFNTQCASKLKGGQGRSTSSTKPGREKEIEVSERGFTCIIGVDEAGRGPIAGPVVAAACHIPLDVDLEKEKGIILKDSKKLSERKREEIFEELRSHPQIMCSWAVIPHNRIDKINILEATFEAMDEAVSKLARTPDYVLVDGNMVPKAWTATHKKTKKGIRSSGDSDGSLPNKVPPFHAEPIVKGDSTCVAIAAASIVAKVISVLYMHTSTTLAKQKKRDMIAS